MHSWAHYHKRTGASTGVRPYTTRRGPVPCAAHDCRGVYVHVRVFHRLRASVRASFSYLDRSRGFRPVSVDEPGYAVYFSPCPEPRYGYIFMVDGGRGRGARGILKSHSNCTALRWYNR
jgi:hypothetical protein